MVRVDGESGGCVSGREDVGDAVILALVHLTNLHVPQPNS